MADRKKKKKQSEPIHPKAMESLRAKLDTVIESCELDHGSPKIVRESNWGWDFASAVQKYKGSFLSIGDAWGILIDRIKDGFLHEDYDKRPSGKLTKLIPAKAVEALKDYILTFIESVPRKYSVYIRLYDSDKSGMSDLSVARNIDLIHVDENHSLLKIKRGWELESSMARRLFKMDPSKDPVFFKGNVLLRIKTEGYAQSRSDQSAIAPALSSAKCLFYLGQLQAVFNYERKWGLFGGKLQTDFIVVDESSGNDVAFKIELPSEIAGHMAGYALAPKKEDQPSLQVFRVLNFQRIGRLLDTVPGDVNRDPIATAAEWAFDSMASTNQTVSFIQLCIALEAILGDEDLREGIVKTLSDRCAYLLGKTVEDRAYYRTEFEKLYDHRSKLVHGRSVTLREGAESSLHFGKHAIDQVLFKEFFNFMPGKKPQESK